MPPIYELGHAMYCTETDTSAVSYSAKELVLCSATRWQTLGELQKKGVVHAVFVGDI